MSETEERLVRREDLPVPPPYEDDPGELVILFNLFDEE